MIELWIVAIVFIASLGIGVGLGIFFRNRIGKTKLHDAKQRVEEILKDAGAKADSIRKEAELEAKEAQLKAKEVLEREMQRRQEEFHQTEKRLQTKEDALEKRFETLEKKGDELKSKEQSLTDRQRHAEGLEKRYADLVSEIKKSLERVSGLSAEDAKRELKDALLEEVKRDAAKRIQEIEQQVKEDADKKAKHIISIAIERLASEYSAERTVSVVQLPNDEMKGRIIGREGRNIRALEAATGVDIMIDDTPEAVIISGFNPVRREIARLTLVNLIADGRIHPTRIEEMVAKVTKEVETSMKETGEKVCLDLNITNMHLELMKLLGALKYRFSYAQNILQHSIEVAHICGMMAAELGLNQQTAKRAALLHDIGKAVSHEAEGGHALVGMEYCKKYGEASDIYHAVGAHHEDIPQETALDLLVDAADALSGARPGARREVLEAYVKRIEELERISTSFKGVEKAYAIQAGREIRVMVQNEQLNDAESLVLCKDIAKKIEEEMTYPGQIKVTVIREIRSTEYAK